MAAPGFRGVRCLSCHEEYEIADNPWNRKLPSCVVRAGNGKCGGMLEIVKSGGPRRPVAINALPATSEDASDLEAMLAPRGELERRLE